VLVCLCVIWKEEQSDCRDDDRYKTTILAIKIPALFLRVINDMLSKFLAKHQEETFKDFSINALAREGTQTSLTMTDASYALSDYIQSIHPSFGEF
jgi:hypothetical protein